MIIRLLVVVLGLSAAPVAVFAGSARVATSADSALTAPADSALTAPVATAKPVLTLPEVRVELERALSDARRALPTAFVTELAAGASGRAVESLPELLDQAAGVHVDQYGGLGAFSTVSLRGAAPGQVTVLLDGVPLTSAAHAEVNLSDLPVSAVDRVEIYRGLAPLALGAATPGGAINLVTRSTPVRELSLAAGSFGTWEGRGTTGIKRGALSAMIHAGYLGSDGDFRYFDDNGTPYNPADDAMVARANNRLDTWTALAALGYEPSARLRLDAGGHLFTKRQGVPGSSAAPALETSLDFDRALGHAGLSWSIARGGPVLRAHAALDRERTQFRDPAGELGQGRHSTDDRIASGEGTLALEWETPGGWLALESGAALRDERADLTDSADGAPDPPQSTRRTRGAVVSARLRPLGAWLTLHAAQRWDRIDDRLASTGVAGRVTLAAVSRALDTPQLGARVVAPLGFEARANWTRAQRVPTFDELFGRQGSIVGNPALGPEQVETWDAGGAWSRGLGAGRHAEVTWSHFESQAEDLIVYQRAFQLVRPANMARADIRGEELSATLGVGRLVAEGSFTWQTAIDRSPFPFWYGRPLPLRPARQAYGRLAWRHRSFQLTGNVQYIGDNYLNPGARGLVPSRTIAGASITLLPFGSELALTVEGKNLGDNQIEDVAGFPLPGRSLFVSCTYRGAPASAPQP